MCSYLCARLFSMGPTIRSGKRNLSLDCLQPIHTPLASPLVIVLMPVYPAITPVITLVMFPNRHTVIASRTSKLPRTWAALAPRFNWHASTDAGSLSCYTLDRECSAHLRDTFVH